MKNKIWIVLTVIFLSQLIISCCDCSSALSYENTYTGVSIIPYDISGFNLTEVNGKVYKNAFGLGVSVNFDSEVYACKTNPVSSFGFSLQRLFLVIVLETISYIPIQLAICLYTLLIPI